MSQPRVEVKNLSKVFFHSIANTFQSKEFDKQTLSADDKLVLDNINFVLHAGETVGIIGQNGAGKSTLLSILAGISKKTQGEINISGKVTAVMTLGVGLREDLTGRDNIYLDGQLQGKSKADINKVIDEIIDFSELDDFIDKPIKTYSTGMKSRLAFSMLVGIEPEILIIDEALSAGDAFFAEKATRKIKEICKKGKIVIIVSHSMLTIETMCNRCLWLEKGSIIMDDEPTKVTQHYLKKVREADQRLEVQHHKINHAYMADHANFKVLSVKQRLSQSDYEQTIFYVKDSFTIEIELERHHMGVGNIHVVIERLDGLIVSHEECAIDEQDGHQPGSFFNLQFSLDSLVLNKGYYQLRLELLEDTELTNQFIKCFEVKNDYMPKGGSAVLHYPADVLSLNEEVNLCSDSIDLITE